MRDTSSQQAALPAPGHALGVGGKVAWARIATDSRAVAKILGLVRSLEGKELEVETRGSGLEPQGGTCDCGNSGEDPVSVTHKYPPGSIRQMEVAQEAPVPGPPRTGMMAQREWSCWRPSWTKSVVSHLPRAIW